LATAFHEQFLCDLRYNEVAMYDFDPRPPRRGHPVLASFVTSLLTTAAAFLALTVAERRGYLEPLLGRAGSVEVPSVIGVTVEQARDLLQARGLMLTLQAERPDRSVPAGKIAGQVPMAGSRAAQGTAIQAFVSSGSDAVALPDLAGARVEDAVEQLRSKKLLPGSRREEASATVAAGLVIGTDPPAGKAVTPDGVVTLIVSTGPAGKPVPKIVGLRISKAKKAIEAAGFKVGSTKYGSSDNYDEDVVIKQDPADSALAPPGSPINLVINE
jgi:serine/threonine-protein kinase